MFCKYCGEQIKEGEVCACRQTPGDNTVKMRPPVDDKSKQRKKRIKSEQVSPKPVSPKPVKPEKEPKSSGGGKGLIVLSFLCSAIMCVAFVLLRFVLQDVLPEISAIEGFYPYLIYCIPLIFGVIALLLAIFSLQDKGIRKLSLAGILVSVLFIGGIFGVMAVFPYEADSYEDSDDDEDDEDEEDPDEKDKDSEDDKEEDEKSGDKEESETVSALDKIQKDYEAGTLDYVQAKNALLELNTDELEAEEGTAVLELQETIEQDLQKKMDALAASSDYKGILTTLSDMEEASETEDIFLTELRKKYEPEYILYLDAESKKLTEAGKKDEAIKMLEEAQTVVTDEEVIGSLIMDAQNAVGAGDYIIPGSESRYLTSEDISSLTIQQINYAKNEIYARHGRKFKSNELQTYFNSKSWYNGTIEPAAFTETVLNDYEKKNAELLSKREFSMESGGYKLDVN